MTSVTNKFQPYITNVHFEPFDFKFKIFTQEAQDQHDTGPNHPHYRKDINVSFYGYEQFMFIQSHMIEPNDVIVDVGGEYGFTTCLFSKLTGDRGRVLTVEAHPWMANCISQNVKLNSLSNVKVLNAAAGSEDGKILKFGGSSVSSDDKGISVKTVCLDSFSGLHPDFIKIDIEGYEVEALRGARSILAQTPKLQVELHAPLLPNYGSNVEDFFSLLPMDRYSFFIQWEGDQSTVVSFDPESEMHKINNVVQIFCIPKPSHSNTLGFPARLRRGISWIRVKA